MLKKETLKIGDVVYIFNPKDRYSDYTFISIKKFRKFKDQNQYQVITIKNEDWEKFKGWFVKIIENDDE